MLSTYKINGNQIEIQTSYCEDVVSQCRKWGGKFDSTKKCWIVSASRLPEIQALLGANLDDQVEVEVGNDDIDGYAQIHVGWYVLAGRRSRDYSADIYADLVAGEIPSSGGSVKNPSVAASRDARFRLRVPRDFAVTKNLTIVDSGIIDRDILEAERESLLKRVAEIDAQLLAVAK